MTSEVFSFPFRRRLSRIVIFQLFFLASLVTLPFSARARHSPHDHAGMSMDAPVDPAMQAKLLSDKRESEFNHHLAGFFVVLAALFILVESWLSARPPRRTVCLAGVFPALRYFRPYMQRHRALAIRSQAVAARCGDQSRGDSAQDLRRVAPRPWRDRAGQGAPSSSRSLGRLGFSRHGHRRLHSPVVSLSRRRNARTRPHGHHGPHSDPASQLFAYRLRYRSYQGARGGR
jgi:hypothetical protein